MSRFLALFVESLQCTISGAIGGAADMPRARRAHQSGVNDPDCVKTPRGITAPGILGSMVMRRTKKRKNLSSARHHDQIRFRFHTTKTHSVTLTDEFIATHRATSRQRRGRVRSSVRGAL